MQYNKIPIIMDQCNFFFNYLKTYILTKLDPFQQSVLQDTLVYLYELQSWQN